MGYTIDLKIIAQELGFEVEDVEMLVEVFLETSIDSMQDLKDAIDVNDLDAIFSSAHAIKGSAANLTLLEITNIAKDIEENARELNAIDYLQSYKKLELLIQGIKA